MGRRRKVALAGPQPRSALTCSQQRSVRARLMSTASAITHQLDEFITSGKVIVAGRQIEMTPERLATYRLVLAKTVPDLASMEITHKSGLEGMDLSALVNRLGQLARDRPDLKARLLEALGGKVINSVVGSETAEAQVTAEPLEPGGAAQTRAG